MARKIEMTTTLDELCHLVREEAEQVADRIGTYQSGYKAGMVCLLRILLENDLIRRSDKIEVSDKVTLTEKMA